MQGGSVSQDVLLYGPAGMTPAPVELARNNACDKVPPILLYVPPRQATPFGIQNIPVANGSGRFAIICAPSGVRAPPRPVYSPAGLTPFAWSQAKSVQMPGTKPSFSLLAVHNS